MITLKQWLLENQFCPYTGKVLMAFLEALHVRPCSKIARVLELITVAILLRHRPTTQVLMRLTDNLETNTKLLSSQTVSVIFTCNTPVSTVSSDISLPVKVLVCIFSTATTDAVQLFLRPFVYYSPVPECLLIPLNSFKSTFHTCFYDAL